MGAGGRRFKSYHPDSYAVVAERVGANHSYVICIARCCAEFIVRDDCEIGLSSDAEGNEILPMPTDPRWSLAIDADGKEITLFPPHR